MGRVREQFLRACARNDRFPDWYPRERLERALRKVKKTRAEYGGKI